MFVAEIYIPVLINLPAFEKAFHIDINPPPAIVRTQYDKRIVKITIVTSSL